MILAGAIGPHRAESLGALGRYDGIVVGEPCPENNQGAAYAHNGRGPLHRIRRSAPARACSLDNQTIVSANWRHRPPAISLMNVKDVGPEGRIFERQKRET